jgi:hypothetical protein
MLTTKKKYKGRAGQQNDGGKTLLFNYNELPFKVVNAPTSE